MRPKQSPQRAARIRNRSAIFAAGFLFLIAVTAQAQTYTVLHNFTGGADGGNPQAAITIDSGGNLYGTAAEGGQYTWGTVFRLVHKGTGWVTYPLYSFTGNFDGANPLGPLTIGPDGAFYGTTLAGGNGRQGDGCGVVFKIRPPANIPPNAFSPWTEIPVYIFQGPEGCEPVNPQLIFDQAGNIYGTTQFGGSNGLGVVFKLTPSGGSWTESVVYGDFLGSTGEQPYAGVIADKSGNLYGTTSVGGNGGDGVAYELSPTQSGYVQTILHYFRNGDDGGLSYGGLVMDSAGNLYGATLEGGVDGCCGVAYQLSPSNGGWILNPIYNEPCCGEGTMENLAIDAAGNLYGTDTQHGANGLGMVFKLSYSNGTWTVTDLHDFNGNDGSFPYAPVTVGPNGNLYGTTYTGGTNDKGVVYEITP